MRFHVYRISILILKHKQQFDPMPLAPDKMRTQRKTCVGHARWFVVRTERGMPTKKRRGIATVEFAVVFPILLLMVLGTIEICQRLFLRQSATIAAYEGIRLAARSTSNAPDVIERCQQLLSDRRIAGGQVTLTPNSFQNLPTGSPITVEVRVPWSSNSVTKFVLRDQGNIVVRAVMLRE